MLGWVQLSSTSQSSTNWSCGPTKTRDLLPSPTVSHGGSQHPPVREGVARGTGPDQLMYQARA